MATNAPVYWATRDPVITEEAGTRGGTHMGVDLAAERGDDVIAPIDGTVIFVGDDGARGKLPGTNIVATRPALVVRIRRDDGLIAHVAHMDSFAPGLAVGQTVVGGRTVVGGAGDSGWSTGVHVHMELRWDLAWSGGRWQNPRDFSPQTPPSGGAAIIRKDTRMHAVRQLGLPDSGVIIGGGQPPRARPNSVFVAECQALGITPVDCPAWQYETVVREAWADFSTTTRYVADAVAGKIPAGSTVPLGLSEKDRQAIAKAVADEQAKRMQS